MQILTENPASQLQNLKKKNSSEKRKQKGRNISETPN